MKILILCTKLPWPARDGGSIATLNLARGLAESGCQVTFLTMNTPKHYFPSHQIPEFLRDLINIRTVDVDTGIKKAAVLGNLLFSSYPYNAQRFISAEFKREIEYCLGQTEYDIIQLEGPYLAWYIPVIRKLSNAKITLRAHNLEHRLWRQTAQQEKGMLRKPYLAILANRIRQLEADTLGKIDLLVPISGTDEAGFLEMGASIPVFVCPPGLDVSRYHKNEQLDAIKLFFIGALDWLPNQQGLDWFFKEVWPGILEKWPEKTISLAGRNQYNYFTKRIVPINVSVKGELEDSMDFYQQYNVMIVPLLSGSGIRVKILEAMAMGKIVISTSTGASGLNAIAGDHLFIADTPKEFIRVIQMMEDSPSLLKDMGDRARRFVTENFDNLAITKNLISFYKEPLG